MKRNERKDKEGKRRRRRRRCKVFFTMCFFSLCNRMRWEIGLWSLPAHLKCVTKNDKKKQQQQQ